MHESTSHLMRSLETRKVNGHMLPCVLTLACELFTCNVSCPSVSSTERKTTMHEGTSHLMRMPALSSRQTFGMQLCFYDPEISQGKAASDSQQPDGWAHYWKVMSSDNTQLTCSDIFFPWVSQPKAAAN